MPGRLAPSTSTGVPTGSEPESQPSVSVLPPSWRPDLTNGPDLVEEVARVRGYDQIPSVLPTPKAGHGLTHGQRVRRVVANTLAQQGLVEVLTYPFVAESLADVPDAIARVHAAGPALRRSTADWFARNARRLSLASSLDVVAASYRDSARS